MAETVVIDIGTSWVKAQSAPRAKRKSGPPGASTTAQLRASLADDVADATSALTRVAPGWSSASQRCAVLLTSPFVGKLRREVLLRNAFEALDATSVFLGYDAVGALLAAGVSNGTVLDTGSRESRVVHIVDAQPLRIFSTRTAVGGANQSDALRTLLLSSGAVAQDQLTPTVLHEAKTAFCETLPRGSSQLQRGVTKNVVLALPDGERLPVDVDASGVATLSEGLLRPWQLHPETGSMAQGVVGVADLLCASMREVFADFPAACRAWVCVGGPSGMSGFQARVADEMAGPLRSMPTSATCASMKQLTVQDPHTAAVTGMSLFTQLGTFGSHCITRAAYAEQGPARCLEQSVADRL